MMAATTVDAQKRVKESINSFLKEIREKHLTSMESKCLEECTENDEFERKDKYVLHSQMTSRIF